MNTVQIINAPGEGPTGKVTPTELDALSFDQFQNGYYVTGEQAGRAWHAGAGLMKK